MRTILQYPLLLLAWAVTRWLIVREAFHRRDWIFGDVSYYFSEIINKAHGKPALREYPEANLWILRPLSRIIDATGWPANSTYTGFVLLLDAIFLLALMRGKHWRGSWFWVLFGLVSGPIFISRLDLVPGMLVGLFAVFLVSHPRFSSFLLALATAMKLWPGVLATSLVGPARQLATWVRIGAFGVSLLALAGFTVLTQGLDRLLSPLDYQNVRGLQIESVAATPFMLMEGFKHGSYQLSYAASKSFEITGPGVAVGERVASYALYAVVLLAALEVVRRLVGRPWDPQESMALAVVLVLALLVTNKVLSPQYLTWLGPLLAVALSRSRDKILNLLAGLSVLCSYLTYLVFPKHYGDLIGGVVRFDGVVPLVTRNILLVVMLGVALTWWMRVQRSAKIRLSQGSEHASQLIDVPEGVEGGQRNRDGSPAVKNAHRF
ncbi:hypothetical protein [Corynebacterium epidermidicanis]|uniref:DUF2029 domain-containing protein n=1 Tax=Corynebacterium epidermidicanis TaxID=1050174 RepID=A0A0G3GR98_9CORY|nr:hypothetical protein [Corynebacterium epidermidicanis]AKK02103.1 hypothetical protein CEPID_01045 [Corynebacterium epidermidicanis]